MPPGNIRTLRSGGGRPPKLHLEGVAWLVRIGGGDAHSITRSLARAEDWVRDGCATLP